MRAKNLTEVETRLLKRYKLYKGAKFIFLIFTALLTVAFFGFWLFYQGKHDPVAQMRDTLASIVNCLLLVYAFNARVQHCETLLRKQAENE